MKLKWLGHASWKLKAGGKTIYIDPYQGDYDEKAELILSTHSHTDHCDPKKIKRIKGDGTVIIAPADSPIAAIEDFAGGDRPEIGVILGTPSSEAARDEADRATTRPSSGARPSPRTTRRRRSSTCSTTCTATSAAG